MAQCLLFIETYDHTQTPHIRYGFSGQVIGSSQRPLSDNIQKTARKKRTDIGKYSFVNRSITDWNQLPEWAIGTSHGKTHIFKTRVRKVQNSGGSEGDIK